MTPATLEQVVSSEHEERLRGALQSAVQSLLPDQNHAVTAEALFKSARETLEDRLSKVSVRYWNRALLSLMDDGIIKWDGSFMVRKGR